MVCNTCISLIPKVNGKIHHFRYGGLHNGLALLVDRETHSYWDHLTGECVHGPMQGYQLEGVAPIEHMVAGPASKAEPEALIAISKRGPISRGIAYVLNRSCAPETKGFIPPHFFPTMVEPNAERSMLELGLGIWIRQHARFYPFDNLSKDGSVRFDTLAGRRMAIFVDKISGVPSVIFTEATAGEWKGDALHFNNGQVLDHGKLRLPNGNGSPKTTLPERPKHVFTRWYGFSYMFPTCEVANEEVEAQQAARAR